MSLDRQVFMILASRAARTFPLGILGVILPIYLSSYGSSILGLFFSISVISSTCLLVVLSFYGHRINVIFILLLQSVTITACLVTLSLSAAVFMILFASFISLSGWAPGGGSGSGGGAYNTTLNILLSERTDSKSRTLALSLSSMVGSLAFACGAYLLGYLNLSKEELLSIQPFTSLQSIFSFHSSSSLFLFSALVSLFSGAILILLLRSRHTASYEDPKEGDKFSLRPSGGQSEKKRRSVRAVFHDAASFVAAELANGFGNGLYQQIAPLWFYLRFGISVGTVGEIFAGASVVTAFVILLSPKLESRIGRINAIFYARAGYGLLLFSAALAPSLLPALVFYYSSLILLRVSTPIQQSLVFSKIRKEEWTRASSMIAISNVTGISIGPLLGSFLLLDVNLALPLMLAFPLILTSAIIYKFARTFKNTPALPLST